jgi:hypothetical protein
VEIHYRQYVFQFEQFPSDSLEGRLLLDDAQLQLLVQLVRAEDDCWYLDDDAERLPAAQLFERSPWSCPGPRDPIKLLCRILDLRDGRALFSTRETYLEGGLYDWMRSKKRQE